MTTDSPTTVAWSEYFGSTWTFRVGANYVMSHDLIIRGIDIQPACGYRPPTPDDRWGVRDDLRVELGSLWMRCFNNRTYHLGAVLDFMDDGWLREHAWDDLRDARQVLRIIARNATEHPTSPDAAAALGSALALASRECETLITKRARVRIDPPIVIPPRTQFTFYRTATTFTESSSPPADQLRPPIAPEGLQVLCSVIEKIPLGEFVLR
jgi:hypothetical protein